MTTYTDIVLHDTSNNYFIPYALIERLGDVAISNPTTGQNLTYDANTGKWKNTSTTATIAWGGITGTLSDQTDLTNALNGKQESLVSGTNIKTINNTSLLGNGNIDALQNTATGSLALTILGTAQTTGYGTNVGYSTQANEYSNAFGHNAKATGKWAEAFGGNCTASGNWSVVLGHNNVASGYGSTALGCNASATANYAIQLGEGTNSTASTLSVGFSSGSNYPMLDGTTGYIPNDRINPTINTLSSYVAKAGDTMTDSLIIENSSGTAGTILKSTTITKGTAPSSNAFTPRVAFVDKNGDAIGAVYLRYDTNKNVRLSFSAYSDDNSDNAYMYLEYANDGTKTFVFPQSNRCDGQWVEKYSKLADTSGTKAGTTYSLSSYLPNDNYKYNVKFRLFAYTNSSTCSYYCNTDIFNNGQTTTSPGGNYCYIYGGGYSRQNTVVFDLPVGTGRYVKLYGEGADTIILCAIGYRRIGTNS